MARWNLQSLKLSESLSHRELHNLQMTCIAIAYSHPDILIQQAVGVTTAVLNKMVDDTDNQKKVENAENNTALCSTRYT